MTFPPKIKDFLSKLTVSENKFTGVGGKTTKKALLPLGMFKDKLEPLACPWYVQ